MTNPMRGEAPLGEHKLVVDFNGWCSLEDAMGGQKVPELIAMMRTGIGFGFKEMRTFIRVFLDKQMTDAEVGTLIGDLGMAETQVPDPKKKGATKTETGWVAAEALSKAIDGFFASPKENGGNPPKAA